MNPALHRSTCAGYQQNTTLSTFCKKQEKLDFLQTGMSCSGGEVADESKKAGGAGELHGDCEADDRKKTSPVGRNALEHEAGIY